MGHGSSAQGWLGRAVVGSSTHVLPLPPGTPGLVWAGLLLAVAEMQDRVLPAGVPQGRANHRTKRRVRWGQVAWHKVASCAAVRVQVLEMWSASGPRSQELQRPLLYSEAGWGTSPLPLAALWRLVGAGRSRGEPRRATGGRLVIHPAGRQGEVLGSDVS